MTDTQERYQLYLQSDHWTGLRLEAFRKYGRKCSRCPVKHSLEVHHVRYRYPWESCSVGDVVILCHWCHQLEHTPALRIVPDAIRRTAQKKRRRISRRQRLRWEEQKRNEEKIRKCGLSVYVYTKPYSVNRKWKNRGNSSN